MGLFSKKKDDEFFDLTASDESQSSKIEADVKLKPDALTVDEVLGHKTVSVNNSKTNALDNIKKRMLAAAEQKDDTATQKHKTEDLNVSLPKEDVAQTKSIDIASPSSNSKPEPAQPIEENKSSLLDKCKPYILDDNGKETAIDTGPLYKLQSVAEILKSETDKSIEMLSKKYDFSFDDLGYKKSETKQKSNPDAEVPKAKAEEKIPVSKNTLEEKVKTEKPEPEVFEEKISFKNMQSNVSSIISDIDVPNTNIKKENKLSNTATITFTPVNTGKKSGQSISVSSKTRPIDLTGELLKLPETAAEESDEIQLEKNEFEEFTPDKEVSSNKDAVQLVREFSIKKRRSFICVFFSILLTILFSTVKIPFISELLLSHTRTGMIICAAVTGIIILLNLEMFKSVATAFSKKSNADICAVFATLTTAAYAVFGIINQSIISDILLLLNIILSFRSLGSFFKNAYMLSNLKQICSSTKKYALRLINDPAITFSMAKNAVDGDALIAAPQKTDFIADYMKYSQYGTFLGGKLKVINILSLIISFILGIVCSSYFGGIVYGLYAVSAIQCFTALPVIFFIEHLPLYSAAKKLNKKGAMIAGKTGAEFIEMANAMVLSASDLFPSGTVTLHQMKVLSENSLDDTIIRAASLTESLNSPLTPIFKKIAGTSDIATLPDSDTVKYEDRMGISGWVDDRLLFIGNRTLMEAHGIEVPSVEVDRKILRSGYFPIYVATRDKACALLIVQYDVNREIARELRKIASLGVTMLINSCDPNLTEEMICDYFGLYEDSVKIMSAAGCHMYKNAVSPLKTVSAPAAFRHSPITLAGIINCASKIKSSNIWLTIMYVVSLVLGSVIFAYSSLAGSGQLVSENTVLLYGLISTVISYLIYLVRKP